MGVTVFLTNGETLNYFDGKDWRWSQPNSDVVNIVNYDGRVIATFNLGNIVGLEKEA